MPKNVTIFTTNTCAYCHMVKKYLTSKNIKFQEVNLDTSPDRRQEAIEASGALTVPVTIVDKSDDSTEVVVGWNPGKLAGAIAV